jgi:hypothetical protein
MGARSKAGEWATREMFTRAGRTKRNHSRSDDGVRWSMRNLYDFFIESKNSALFLVALSLSIKNSVASNSSIANIILRSTQTR